jgi:CheY-like chemotaxis protein
MVYGFIKQSGGHVQVDSAPGQGTTIRLYLPGSPAADLGPPDTTTATGPVASEVDPRGKTILVIEDDAIVRGMAVDMLTSLGYRTVQAGDGREALRVLDETEKIDLLFTDVVLPGDLNGPAIVRLARKRYPGIKCLYCSAYPRDALVDDGFLEGNVELIEKPYKKAALTEKLSAVMAR